MMPAKALDFFLPNELNATLPPEKRGLRRDHVRMMVLNRCTGEVNHDRFFHLSHYLQPGDLIILNNSRTIPALLRGKWKRDWNELSQDVEVRLAKRRNEDTWDAFIMANPIKVGDKLLFSDELISTVIAEKENSPLKTIQFNKRGTDLYNIIYSIGEPIRYEYIEKPWGLDDYQTVFASHPGSVEMPSAGRAFSWELLFKLKQKNIGLDFIQLHTGLSYFDEHWELKPEENEEEYQLSAVTMEKIVRTKTDGGRVIAVGTTVVRALETAARTGNLSGFTNLYVNQETPLKVVDGILTGFHEPKASHLDMLTAFIPEQHLLHAYHQAIDKGYLWHEFGDMNLIL